MAPVTGCTPSSLVEEHDLAGMEDSHVDADDPQTRVLRRDAAPAHRTTRGRQGPGYASEPGRHADAGQTADRIVDRIVAWLTSVQDTPSWLCRPRLSGERKTAVAATASVGATIAPRAKTAGQPSVGMATCATNATTIALNSTRPMERRASGRDWREAPVSELRLRP